MTPTTGPTVRPITAADEAQWRPLFRGYREFYRLEPDEAVIDRVWSWLLDPEHEVRGIGVEHDGELVGIGHYRRFARPSTGTVGIWLDDLFTKPDARGAGAARALLEAVRSIAAEEGCSIVRGITAEDNHRAQALYDQLGTRTNWVVYDGAPAAPRAE
ncbi:MAG: GNAT family N-acetyltransferase [Microbacteriaceae bacterium]|nr:GNAT family N-acetyltransferase [Microbacteriaceae bacterium]